MKQTKKTVRAAIMQASPVLFDKEKSVQKIIELVRKAGAEGAELIVFPESFIPAYPRGFSYGFVVGSRTMEGRKDWKRYYDNAIAVPGYETELLSKAAKEASVYLSVGVTEQDKLNCTLYCSNLIFGPDGTLLSCHRKLKPTGSERCIWGEGDGKTLDVVDTPFGKMGALTCWENYMPLARAAMYQKGISIYLAPTADSREEWQCTMRHIALEGRCFVLSCNQYVTKSMYPKDFYYTDEIEKLPEELCPGGSCIVDPFGKYAAGPVWNKEECIMADLPLDQVVLSRLDFDPCGHYSRPDVFTLSVQD